MDENCLLEPQWECLGLIKARELERDLGELKEAFNELRRQNSHRHEQIFEQIHTREKGDLAHSLQYDNIMSTLKNLAESIDLLSKRLSEIEMKPARRWEDTIKQILGILEAALGAFLLGKFGML